MRLTYRESKLTRLLSDSLGGNSRALHARSQHAGRRLSCGSGAGSFHSGLQRSVFHIQSSGKGVVKPINILVAIFSEKESQSVFILNKYKISRLAVVTYLSHGPKNVEENSVMVGIPAKNVGEVTTEDENFKPYGITQDSDKN